MTVSVARQHVESAQDRRVRLRRRSAVIADDRDLQANASNFEHARSADLRIALPGANRDGFLSRSTVMGMQRSVGNRVVSRRIASASGMTARRPGPIRTLVSAAIHRCGDTPCDCSPEERAAKAGTLRRIPSPSSASPPPTAAPAQAGTAQGLGSTPAAGLAPIPDPVRRDHANRLAAGDHLGALMVIVRHMESVGEIDPSIMAAPVATSGGATVCQATVLWDADPSMGRSAVETPCGCSGPADDKRPNVRIRAGTGAIADLEHLHSAIFHEFRHVRQDFEACRGAPSPGLRFAGACTDCNKPEELDSYLAEAEAGYNATVIRHAWARVVSNWTWLAPEQQMVFLARVRTLRGKIERLFPGIDWENDAEVRRYSAFCSQMDQRAGGDTAGSCDSALAPLTAPGPRPGLPLPPPPPPIGDFELPPKDRAIA